MRRNAKSKKITASSQFVGYWGYGGARELEDLLDRVFPCQVKPRKNEYYPIWNIAYISENLPQGEGEIKEYGISISGISNYIEAEGKNRPDAWVEVGEKDSLILGREPFGRVPLYWRQIEQVIWFASQLQLLLPIEENPQVSMAGLYGYSCFSYVPTPETPVKNISAIPAGTKQTWEFDRASQTISLSRTHRLLEWREGSAQIEDERIAIGQLQTLLKNAIINQIRDIESEPVGVFLSGGLDSSIIAALLVQAGVKVRAYSLDFGAAGISEYPYAEQVADYLKIPLIKVDATPRRIQTALIPTVKALDLPFGDGVTVPLYLLSQTASQETKIIFNGEGGDQLFAGWTNKPIIAASIYQTAQLEEEKIFLQNYLRTFHRLWEYEHLVYSPEIYRQIQQLLPEIWLKDALDRTFCTSLLHRLRRATLMLKGAQNIHPRATNLGLAHGLKVRSPFCDLPLTKWTFRVSGKLYLQAACEKYILKRAVENLLPPEIVWRQKRGMGVPLTSWCFNELWPQIGAWLNPGKLRQENRFLPHLATQIIAGKLGGTIQGRRLGEILWLLIMWELWREEILGEPTGGGSLDHPFWLPNWLWRYSKQWKD